MIYIIILNNINMNINNTNFPIEISNFFKKEEKEFKKEKNKFLLFHQYLVKKYFIDGKPDFRGVLVYFGTGMGKTITAISIAEYYRSLDKNRKIIIMSAKSLQSNFYDSIMRYMKDEENLSETEAKNKINADYRFVTSNASNMIQQLKGIKQEKSKLPLLTGEEKMEQLTNLHKKNGFLENSLLIVDEVHNIMNSIVNGSKIAINFYDLIMNAKNIKLIFLTGTPIVNTPFEMVPMFNMLFGYPFFPEVQEDFDEWFIDLGNKDIKNKGKLSNYLIGRISYYGSEYLDPKKGTQEGFPTELPIVIEEVPMSIYQYNVYNNARILERKEASRGLFKGAPSRFGTGKSAQSSTYRVKTRQISNFAFPENIYKSFNTRIIELKQMKDAKEAQKIRKTLKSKMVDELTPNDIDLQGLKIYSPKMLKIIDNINKEMLDNKMLGVVYSEFVTGEGLTIFAKVLKTLGWNEFNVSNFKEGGAKNKASKKENRANIKEVKTQKNIRAGNYTYTVISGDISPEDRSIIVKTLNSPKNARGEIINLLLLSSTGAEGLDLKGIRHIHIMEPYWNMARIQQIKARGVRFKSHEHLAVNEQNVQVFIYLSVYPKEMPKSQSIDELTTDNYIYHRAIDNQIIIDKFLKLFVNTSVDCSIHKSIAIKKNPSLVKKNIKCKICKPNNKQLYYSSLKEDMNITNPCIELENDDISDLTEQITAKELVLEGGKKVYYTVDAPGTNQNILDRIHIYEYSPSLEGYTELPTDSPFYPQILEKVMNILG